LSEVTNIKRLLASTLKEEEFPPANLAV